MTKCSCNKRIGLISFEHMHAMSYASCMKSAVGGTLVCVSDDNSERMEKCTTELVMTLNKYTDWRKMITEEKLDGVIICTANAKHADISMTCADAGLHILCEKPLATTMDDCYKMLDSAKKNNVILMTAFPVRYAPEVKVARDMIRKGELGDVISCVTSNHGSMPGGWFVEAELSGGGAVIDHTVHVIDILRWILDDEVESVYAEYANRLHKEISCEDCGQLLIRFKKGTAVSLDTSWSRPAAYSAWGDVKIDIKGAAGNLSLSCFPRAINFYDNKTMRHYSSSPVAEMDLLLVQEFINCIIENRTPLTTGYDGLKATEVALAAYKAGQSMTPVVL